MIGRVIGGRYRITDRIGGGGMALVYRADDLETGRPVAVKILRTQFGGDDDFVRRFRREASSAASLDHPNIVAIYDVGQEDDVYYIVMELVEGPNLKQRIQEMGSLSVPEATSVALQITDALEHAHERRIIHRDIKPHNIMITADGQVKVTDFGIARATTTNTMTHTGSIIGSAHYFSPEMARGAPAGEKSDIYSLGVVLYEMLTGVLPFQGDSPISVALKHVQEDVIPPGLLEPSIPVELEEIVVKALEKDPQDRFPSVAAMHAALERFLADYHAGTTRVRTDDFPTQRIDMRKRRGLAGKGGWRSWRPWVIWGAVLLLLTGAGFAGWTYLQKMLVVPEVTVPDVRNSTAEAASQKLKDAHLSGEVVRTEPSNTIPGGSVISQLPEANTKVKQGRTVALVLSLGPATVQVPAVRGLPVDKAIEQLTQWHLKAKVKEEYNADEPEGRVFKQDPSDGNMVNEGASVDLYVSKGPIMVPNLAGKSRTDAEAALLKLGLQLGTPQYQSSDKPRDTVVSTVPTAGTPVGPGSQVVLYLSSGAPQTSVEVKVPASAGPPTSKVPVKVELLDQTGTRTIYQGDRTPGDSFLLPVTWSGPTAEVTVYVNGAPTQHVQLPRT